MTDCRPLPCCPAPKGHHTRKQGSPDHQSHGQFSCSFTDAAIKVEETATGVVRELMTDCSLFVTLAACIHIFLGEMWLLGGQYLLWVDGYFTIRSGISWVNVRLVPSIISGRYAQNCKETEQLTHCFFQNDPREGLCTTFPSKFSKSFLTIFTRTQWLLKKPKLFD